MSCKKRLEYSDDNQDDGEVDTLFRSSNQYVDSLACEECCVHGMKCQNSIRFASLQQKFLARDRISNTPDDLFGN